MKRYLYKSIISLTVLIILGGCRKDFYDINVDPNNPGSVSENLALPVGISSAAYVIGGQYQILGEIWSQHWTQSTGAQQYRAIEDYNLTTASFSAQFGELYSGSLNDLHYVSKLAAQNQNWRYYFIAQVMKAYVFQVLADFYDKIPFSEALQGVKNLTPKYDNGPDIYDGLIAMINDAMAKDINTVSSEVNSRVPGADDLIFAGDMTKWVKFANTLKLKIAMRQSIARPAVAAAIIDDLYPAANFLDIPAAMTAFADQENRRNPVYETEVDRFGFVNIVASKTTFDLLGSNGDTRFGALYAPSKTGNVLVALTQGDYTNPGFTNSTNLSQPRLKALDSVYFFTTSESKFLQAEAILRFPVQTGLGDANAKALYEAGIDASYSRLNIAAQPALYGPGGVYEYTGNVANKIEKLLIQKWISMTNIQGVEAFFEQNRTGVPNFFVPSKNNVTGNVFPERLLFPSSEYANNPQNVPPTQPITSKVWWAL